MPTNERIKADAYVVPSSETVIIPTTCDAFYQGLVLYDYPPFTRMQ